MLQPLYVLARIWKSFIFCKISLYLCSLLLSSYYQALHLSSKYKCYHNLHKTAFAILYIF